MTKEDAAMLAIVALAHGMPAAEALLDLFVAGDADGARALGSASLDPRVLKEKIRTERSTRKERAARS